MREGNPEMRDGTWPWKALTAISVLVEGNGKTQVEAVSEANDKALAELDEMRESFGGEPPKTAEPPPPDDGDLLGQAAKRLFERGRLHELNIVIEAAEQWEAGTLDVKFIDYLKRQRRDFAKVGA